MTSAAREDGIDRVVIASTGGWRSVSTQYRLSPVAREGPWPVQAFSADPIPARGQLDPVVAAGGSRAVLILQRVLPSRKDMARLRGTYGRVVFDLDDAIYAVPPRVGGSAAARLAKNGMRLVARGSARASSRKRPLARTLREVDACVVGNAVLGDFVRRFAPRVVEVPTTVEPVERIPGARPDVPVVVWLGLRDNLQYLNLVRAPLARLGREREFVLRVVSTATWTDSPVPVDFVPFSEEATRQALLTATVGLSPLTDDPWTRGKCALRAIQYGGHGLPAVASPVGITGQVVLDGETGFLARSTDEWLSALRALVSNPDRSAQMGARALGHIRRSYSHDLALERWVALIGGRAPDSVPR